MCLILLAWRAHPRCPLIVAANRDERYARPAAPAAWWDDAPEVFAGRDLEGGGTWMGVSRAGRFAAITNYRDPGRHRPGAPSRGALVADFLRGEGASAAAYAAGVGARGARFNGFCLLVADAAELWYVSNREAGPRLLAGGVYGLSNHLLDTPWPKVERGKHALAREADRARPSAERLFEVLADRAEAPAERLPDTGVGRARERALSPLFIRTPEYGTRCSTVLVIDREGEACFEERSFDGRSVQPETVRERLRVAAPAA